MRGIARRCTASHSITQCCTALYAAAQHRAALCSTAQHCTALHSIAQCCSIPVRSEGRRIEVQSRSRGELPALPEGGSGPGLCWFRAAALRSHCLRPPQPPERGLWVRLSRWVLHDTPHTLQPPRDRHCPPAWGGPLPCLPRGECSLVPCGAGSPVGLGWTCGRDTEGMGPPWGRHPHHREDIAEGPGGSPPPHQEATAPVLSSAGPQPAHSWGGGVPEGYGLSAQTPRGGDAVGLCPTAPGTEGGCTCCLCVPGRTCTPTRGDMPAGSDPEARGDASGDQP